MKQARVLVVGTPTDSEGVPGTGPLDVVHETDPASARDRLGQGFDAVVSLGLPRSEVARFESAADCPVLEPVAESDRSLRERVEAVVAAGTDGPDEDVAGGLSASVRRRAMDAAPVGVTIADARADDLPLVYVNEGFERLTGYAASEALGRNCRFLQGPATDPESVTEFNEAIARAEHRVVELRNHRKDGSAFWNRVELAPVADDDGIVTHFVGFQLDVTARRAAETEVERERSDLEGLLDRVNGLLGDVTAAVVQASTRQAVERALVERLADDGRPVEQRTYGLSFPEDNRASFAVDVPKFTYGNRGAPPGGTIPDATAGREGSPATGSDAPDPEALQVRRAHVDAVATIARSPGNVLVGMPNYAEAEWMARELRQRIDKPVLLDEASDDETTESLKGEFFSGEGKVLVTSLRGTLTEGVDYRGDRLAAAAVCGVPLINTASPRTKAVRTAYDRRFGAGFETALLVPAVRKARQAIGRVIRGPEEVGVRALVDARYARDSWDSVREYVPPTEREEFSPVSPDMLEYGLSQFWERADDGDHPEK